MKQQNTANQIWCGLFALLFFTMLVAVYPLWFVLRGGLDTASRENRPLAEFPVPGEVAYEEWPAQLEDYLSDNAPFRNQLMTMNAGINLGLFGTIESPVVLLGQQGWLFYKNVQDSKPLDDYQGINHYTEAQMAEIAANLELLQQRLAQKGIEFVLMIPPAKELVYRRYMPADIPMVNEQSRADALAAYLAANTGVTVVWPEKELRALSQKQQVYYKYDTHWNEAGAAYAAALLLEAMGVPGPAAGGLQYKVSDLPAQYDLANLSATWALVEEDTAWQVKDWMPGIAAERVYADEYLYVERYRSNSGNAQKLLMFRDSFGAAMQLPLAACFAESSFVHINAFDENTFREEAPDVFVLEVTQRYLDRLLDYLPRLVQWAGGD